MVGIEWRRAGNSLARYPDSQYWKEEVLRNESPAQNLRDSIKAARNLHKAVNILGFAAIIVSILSTFFFLSVPGYNG
jgi:hypothetical protein